MLVILSLSMARRCLQEGDSFPYHLHCVLLLLHVGISGRQLRRESSEVGFLWVWWEAAEGCLVGWVIW